MCVRVCEERGDSLRDGRSLVGIALLSLFGV